MKIDFHVHSKYSSDSFMSIDKIVARAKKLGLDGVAITDHNCVPVFKRRYKDFLLIKGEEILTRGGEIIALNIEESIPKLRSIAETVDLIKAQGGTMIVPHPFAFWRKGMMFGFKKIKSKYAFEVLNGMAYTQIENFVAAKYAQDHKLPPSAGSDAHRYKDIGRAYTYLPDASCVDTALKSLISGKGVPFGTAGANWVNLYVFLKSVTKPFVNPFFKRISRK